MQPSQRKHRVTPLERSVIRAQVAVAVICILSGICLGAFHCWLEEATALIAGIHLLHLAFWL
jgi:hypothetical protein